MDESAARGLKARHVAAATLGNALEFYDFFTYGLFAIQIGHAFFPSGSAYASLMLSLATFGAGFLTRPIGAVVIGRYADRAGRKPAMLLSFLLIGASMLGLAVIPSYAVIGPLAPLLALLARLAQGFSLGGELGSNTAFLVEAAAPPNRGLIASWQGVSQNAALVAGSLAGLGLNVLLPPAIADAYGWRIAVLVGVAVVPIGLWLRSSLPETLHAPELQAVDAAREGRLGQYWRQIALGILILGMGSIASYVAIYIVTFAQDTLHMSARAAFIAETGNAFAAMPAILLGGWLSDRYGRWRVNAWGNALLIVSIYPVFIWITGTRSDFALIAGTAILGVTQNLTFGSFCAALAETLPRSVRSAAFGTAYALGIATFGGTTQLVVTWLIHVTGSAMAPAWYSLAAACIAQIAYMLFPESAPARRVLDVPAPSRA